MVKRFAMWVLALCFLGGTARTPAQSISPGWGANPHEGGATFRVWAPGATSVCVAGTFNGWNTTAHPLALESATSGVWSADVPGALTNHGYKYVVNGSLWRSDPRSRIIDSAHNDNSVIAPTNVFAWDGERVGITNAPDLVIYDAEDKPEPDRIAPLTDGEQAWGQLNKISYWMATGAGKTRTVGRHSLINCARRVCRLKGLTSHAFIPTARQRMPSSRMALAVIPIMGSALSCVRRARARS